MLVTHCFLRDPDQRFLAWLSSKVEELEGAGFMGFDSTKSMCLSVEQVVFGEEQVSWSRVSEQEVVEVVDGLSSDVIGVLDGVFQVFVLPCVNAFVADRLGGVSGFCFWRDVCVVFVNGLPGWQQRLRDTLLHELSHAYRLRFQPRTTVADDLVFEGLAEHFKEAYGTPEHSPMVQAIDEVDVRKRFAQAKPLINSSSDADREALIVGSEGFALWDVYRIGYWLVAKQELSWPHALTQPTKTFLSDEELS